jgi:hypothetical protein
VAILLFLSLQLKAPPSYFVVHPHALCDKLFFLSPSALSLQYVSGPDLDHWIAPIRKIAVLLFCRELALVRPSLIGRVHPILTP